MRPRTAPLLRLGALATFAVVLACSAPDRTQVIVVVESDLAPGRLASVRARVGTEGCSDCEHRFPVAAAGAFPFSFGIAPRGGDASREIALLVEGRDETDAVIVSRTVRTRFREGRVVLLRVLLADACASMLACGADRTCIGGACEDDSVDPASMIEIEPGAELSLDAGAPLDAGVDADTRDAATPTARECLDHLERGTTASGTYSIDPDGEGGALPFAAYCDMETRSDGGGWTLIAKVSATGMLGFDATAWTGPEMQIGEPSPELADALLFPYWRLPVAQLRIELSDGAGRRGQTGDLAALTTVRSAMDAGAELTGISPMDWIDLLGGASQIVTGTCARSAVGARMANARVRVGVLIGTTTATCGATESADSWIGIGGASTAVSPCSASMNASGGARLCGNPPSIRVPTPAFGLLWGRSRAPGG